MKTQTKPCGWTFVTLFGKGFSVQTSIADKVKIACNSHDALVEALQGLLNHAEEDEYKRPLQYQWIKKARQALEKAGE